ncbi:sensor histidine kinase [Streptomyces sp. Tu 2975]|uniref:sensor histidine kinase n=1 Tax=Streptomyces sp. Tu 2975 TaxID=2676871 RepID=UPI00135B18AB|nr:sensor histidine kinase [Streptomyces sp. Tu 2975]QIP86763.1 sensor histidine kinase [Streptomyces sp. Tu 2975]
MNRSRTRQCGGPVAAGPPGGFAMLPWLLMGLGAVANLVKGETPNPWVGALGVLAFNTLYLAVVFRAFDDARRDSAVTRGALVALAALTFCLAAGYGGDWLLFFPLLGLAVGAALRGRPLMWAVVPLCVAAGAVAVRRDGWVAISVVYGTFLSSMVTAAVFKLSETVGELRAAREELARGAVEQERLRFSRDLHDLLGHTLSVIVVKAEAARRLGERDMRAALTQIADIEAVGRQALTEIREAVTGYREGSLTAELARARDTLTTAGIDPLVHLSGPLLEPEAETLLGWVVRESVTNVVRHSGASRCEIALTGAAGHARLTVTDDGRGPGPSPGPSGSGLRGLSERLAAAGGTLTSGPAPQGGFRVTAEVPVAAVA